MSIVGVSKSLTFCLCVILIFVLYSYRDISFLCDAMVAHRKTTPLPPLTERSANGDTQVSYLS